MELCEWTLRRSADIPKSQRFTFAKRLDDLSLDTLLLVTEILYLPRHAKAARLGQVNLLLEKLRVLWRLVERQGWIAPRQLLHVCGMIDHIGRQIGGWQKSLASPGKSA